MATIPDRTPAAPLPVISVAQLQRSLAVFLLMGVVLAGELWLIAQGGRLNLSQPARIVGAAALIATLWGFGRLQAWERKRRVQDEAAVRRVIEAARAQGFEVPEDRAIFPVLYRGHKSV